MAASGQVGLSPEPFHFFRPPVTVSTQEAARLSGGETLVKPVAPADGQVAIFSASRAEVTGDRLIRWVRRIEAMKAGPYAPAIARFSDPPRLSDLAALDLDASELDDLRDCRPGSCALKLSETEMATLVPLARARRPGWRDDVQRAFRAALLTRAERYLGGGLSELPPYRDQGEPVHLEQEFHALMAHSAFLRERVPAVADFLMRYPRGRAPEIESFLYWSKEVLGGKPIVSITHVTMTQPAQRSPSAQTAEAVVVSRQVYASHYMSGSLAVTAIVGGHDGPRYLAYMNRSRIDVLDGLWGGLVRRIVERRLRGEAGQVVDGLRRRLEAGEPP